MTELTVTEYPFHKWPRICSICRNHNTALSPIIKDGTANVNLAHELLVLVHMSNQQYGILDLLDITTFHLTLLIIGVHI